MNINDIIEVAYNKYTQTPRFKLSDRECVREDFDNGRHFSKDQFVEKFDINDDGSFKLKSKYTVDKLKNIKNKLISWEVSLLPNNQPPILVGYYDAPTAELAKKIACKENSLDINDDCLCVEKNSKNTMIKRWKRNP